MEVSYQRRAGLMKRRLIIATLLLLLLPTLFIGWVVNSGHGLRWLLTQIVLSKSLEIDTIQGNLLGSLHITGLRYHDDKIKITLDDAMLKWHPSALWHKEFRTEMLYLKQLTVELAASDETPLQLPNIHLPLNIKLDDIQINDLKIIRPEQPTLQINNASLRASAYNSNVQIQYLDISSDIAQLSLHGALHPYDHYWHDLNLQWQLQLPQQPTLNGSGKLKGDLQQTSLEHNLTFPIKATTSLTLFDLLQTLRWQASLQIPKQPLDSVYETWPSEHVALNARGSGDLKQAAIDTFDLQTLNSQIAGKGQFSWHDGIHWQAEVDTPRFDFVALWALLKVNGPMVRAGIKGRVEGDLEQLTASDVTLRAFDGTINGNANVRWSEPLRWQTELRSQALSLTQLWPLMALERQGLPAGRANINVILDGNSQGLTFKQLMLSSLGATVRGNGKVLWQPQLQWQTALSGTGVNPSVWQPQRLTAWHGNLATQFHHRGSYNHNQLLGEVDIQQLSGTLRDYPLQLESQLALTKEALLIKNLSLTSAESHVSAHGNIGTTMDLQLQLDSPQLRQLYPDVSGALQARAQLSGSQSAPLLQLQLDGKQLAYDGQQVGLLKGEAEIQLFSWQKILIDLQAEQLQLAGQQIDALDIGAQGEATDHQLQLYLKTEQLETTWLLSGNLNANTQQWQGNIERADLNNNKLGLWQLASPSALSASTNQIKLAPLCWQQRDNQLCIDIQQQQHGWHAALHGKQINLAMVSPWLPNEMQLHGETTLQATANYTPQQPLVAEARITLDNGYISYPIIDGERSEWRFNQGIWQSNLDAQGLRSDLNLALATSNKAQDQIQATLELKGYNPLTTAVNEQPINGEINANISDLGLIDNLFDDIQGLQGEIKINSRIGGTLVKPQLAGALRLQNTKLQIPRLGLSLTDVQFDANSSGTDTLNYRLQAHSGDGTIEAKGETQLNAHTGWLTEIALTGEMFEVSRIPEARVLVSPNLKIKMAHRELWLNGEVLVPQARLEPKEFSSATTTSSDVVIIGTETTRLKPWRLHNRVRLILGDRVSLYGFGFEGNINGNLLLIDEPGKITAASGELNVIEGRYRAYGQRLDIEQGRLLFAGGPVTNPALDLRAVRHIQDITAGIKVYGPLRQPQFELFSTPVMDQTDALAYLVLGAPLEQTTSNSDGAIMAQAALAIGLKGGDFLARNIGNQFGIEEMRIESSENGEQASLVMGRYLTPRLYVGYGVGIIDATNTLTMRYQLSQHWQIKAESGINQSADMIYTIDSE